MARAVVSLRASDYDVHLARVEAAARFLYEDIVGAPPDWEDAEHQEGNAWRWVAEQALVAAERAAGRTKARPTEGRKK